jgi:hypothetical protein
MRAGERTPELVILAVIVLLVGGALAFGKSDSKSSSSSDKAAVGAGLPSKQKIQQIAKQVEKLRGLKFKKPIEPAVVSDKQATADQLREVDRSYPLKRRQADQELLELLGLVPPGTDLRKVLGDVSSDQVVGYYDTRSKKLRLVSGNGGDSPVLTEITLAHELTHGLEDQNFGLGEDDSTGGGADDEASARTAMVEGTASKIETDYATCCVDASALLTSSLGSLGSAGSLTKLPPYIQSSLLFPYTQGLAFINALYREADGWSLVNLAEKSKPPQSTEQILHPEKYVPPEKPLPVRLAVRPVLDIGWKKTDSGTMGEFDTAELVKLGSRKGAAGGAAGWGGGAYELWQRAGAACPHQPCRANDALVVSWRWDTVQDAREFAPLLALYVTEGLHGQQGSSSGTYEVGGASAVIVSRPRATTLAFAPDADLARRLATRAPADR